MTVGNLAVVAGNQVAIAEAGGLAPMVGMVNGSQYTSCQKFAARALYRLAAHGSNKSLIVAQGGLPPLVRRLRSSDAEVARYIPSRLAAGTHHGGRHDSAKRDAVGKQRRENGIA